MSRTPIVSILMPSFNYAHYISSAIQGVLSQTHSDLELIIVDDCSTDNSRDVVESWRRLDDRIITVCHDVNRGLAGARNSALSASSGQVIALCDADDIWLPEKLEIQLDRFGAGGDTAVVHSDAWIIDREGQCSGTRFSQQFHRPGQKTTGNLFSELCRRNFICVPTVVLRREAILQAGGFDESLRSLEDWVCWTKVAKCHHFQYVDDPLVEYRLHNASLSQNSRNMAASRVKALELLLTSFSDIPSETLSGMLYSLGMSHLELHQQAQAALAFSRSVKVRPIQARSWIRLCQSFSASAMSRNRDAAA